jgi:ribonuclease Z
LTKGESVITPDGRVVHPSDCMGATVPGPVFLLVTCPSPAYLPRLRSNQVRTPPFSYLGDNVEV